MKIRTLGIMLLLFSIAFAGEVYVYNTTLSKPASVEKKLDGKLGDAKVKVFARFVDLKTMVKKGQPVLVIAPELTIKTLGLKPGVQVKGVQSGATDQDLLLVSLDQKVDPAGDLKIGALDIAGRSGMKKFINDAVSPKAKYKSVTKLEDLVPMLTFKSADAILVTQSQLDLLKTRTKANLQVQKLAGKKTGSNAIGANGGSPDKGQADAYIAAVKKLGKKELQALGVESWK